MAHPTFGFTKNTTPMRLKGANPNKNLVQAVDGRSLARFLPPLRFT
jgi:hypothetical protein